MTETDQIVPVAAESHLPEVSSYQVPARILAVDDEFAACKLISLILGPPAFHCTTASSGEEALVALQTEPFDAVISDLDMPGMGGLQLLTQVRRKYPHMAFLVTTGVDDLDVGVQAMRCGADDYLVKPLREGAVAASLQSALHKRRLERQVENYRLHLEEMVVERTAQLQAALLQVERSYEHTLQALGAAIDLRDNQTAGHSQRVCRYSLEIAKGMGWSGQQLGSLARGAYLHDIGKLGIPDGVLLKPGPLTAEERELMQKHAQIGFDLVSDIPFLADAAEIVLTHHERFDGKGYPRGIKGEELLLSARIFAVADTLDAITSERPYQRASSFEEAREIIRRFSGGHFDPEVVNVFLGIAEETWPAIANDQQQPAELSPESTATSSMLRLGLSATLNP
jgi:response regulator RpfG family c-di-GMP phosphodiesterase